MRVMQAMQVMQVMQAIFASIFFSSIGLGGHQSFHQETSRAQLSINYLFKLPARHLESGDDPGDKYKWYNLAPRVLSLSLGN